MNKLIIVGASGHGKVVADIAELNGYNDIVFLDDDENKNECAGFPVIGNTMSAPEGDIFVALGNSILRKKYIELYCNRNQPVLIHPSAVIAKNVCIGAGTVVMAGAVINSSSIIGNGVIINTSSSVDHDCLVSNYSHISVGAHLAGTVSIGINTFVGAGATVINNISVCDNCCIGAGAVVIDNIVETGTYTGVPARRIK